MVAVADILQHRDQMVEVMPVDRPDIVEAQFLEQRAAHCHAARELVGLLRRLVQRLGQFAREAPRDLAQLEEGPRRHQLGEIGRQPAHRRRDRHVVVVEDDDQPVARRRGIVHRLIGHARRHRPVADHRDRAAGLVLQLVGDREAQRRADRGRAVRRAERIIFALAALGEARKAAALAQRADAVAAPGDDLVRIALVADVPHDLVARRVEHIVERGGQLDHAQPRTQMPARGADGADHLGAQFVGELAELVGLQFAEVGGDIHRVEQRCGRTIGHARVIKLTADSVERKGGQAAARTPVRG